MLVSELLDQYAKTSDNDLKYMALRQDIAIVDVGRDLDSIVKGILLPVLLEEINWEIVELVSSQVYPQITSKCISVTNRRGGRQSEWFEVFVVDPLIKHMDGKRRHYIVQTLRNVLKVAFESSYQVFPTGNHHLKTLVSQMNEYKRNSDVGQNMVIYWETLNLMIPTFYFGTAKICSEILDEIFSLCEGKLDALSRSVITSSIQVASMDTVEKLVRRSVSDDMLEAVSTVWWQMGQLAPSLIEERILPAIESDKGESLQMNLQVILNLRPLFHITSVERGTKALDDLLLGKIETRVQNLLESTAEKPFNHTSKEPSDSVIDVEDAEIDEAQQAYLDELTSDADLDFEDDDLVLEDDGDSQAVNICTQILDALKTSQRNPHRGFPQLVDLTQVKTSELAADQIADVVYTTTKFLDNETNLQALLLAVEILNQLLTGNSAEIDYSSVCKSLIPHMKQNKAFLQTIKVGNMTQTIDEGFTLRTMVFSSILQVTTHPIDYPVCCTLLMEAISRGVRDVDPTIGATSIKIIQTLLRDNYNAIRAVDPTWYNGTLLPKTQETATKLHKRLQTTSQDTADHQGSPTIALLEALSTLFNTQYPAIQ